MPEISDIILLFLCGALGGFLSGLLGVGGGVIFIPFLDIIFRQYGIEEELVKYILANSLAVIIFTGLFSSYNQYRAGNFFPRFILLTALPGIVSVLLASYLISLGTWYDKKTFNIVFTLILIPGMVRLFLRRKVPADLHDTISSGKFVLVGFITGIFTAFSGLGGGIVMIPAFVNTLKLEIKKATSVSAGVVPLFALPTAIYYATITPISLPEGVDTLGFIVYPLLIPMILGALATVKLGVITGHRLNPATAKVIFVIFVAIVLSKMIVELFV